MSDDETSDEDLPLVSRNLKRFREELGMTQQGLAEASEQALDNIRRYEQGRSIKAETLKALADALGHTMDDFSNENPPPADPSKLSAFLLKVRDGAEVDDDLRAEVREFLAGINRKVLDRVKAKKDRARSKK